MVARSPGSLIDQAGIDGFGYQHRWLRELGDGWQLLETGGWDDPPDLTEPCTTLAATTGHPALAAYVSNGDCAVLRTAVPGETGPATHLWPVFAPCGSYRHQPRDLPEPAGRGVDEVLAELTAWARRAGLRADTPTLRDLLRIESRVNTGKDADDLLFDLVRALGVARIGPRAPRAFPIDEDPFREITGLFGIAAQARMQRSIRRLAAKSGRTGAPAQPWEAEAIALEKKLWMSLHRTDVNVTALRHAAKSCVDAFHGSRSGCGNQSGEANR